MTPSRRVVLKAAGIAAALAATGCSEPENVQGGAVTITASLVPVGSGYIIPDSNYVVTQPEAGTFVAFSRVCTHSGCPVSQVSTEIVCNCHNSRFSIKDGSVLGGPATAPLGSATVTQNGDQLTVGA
ncbi:MAG TPA: Rieske (2Fe-2S) protein [Propionibacteriaceae bacterium]|nr:Rieske (2Fe-2S) protein [Propionibacteriaceae bacterium]